MTFEEKISILLENPKLLNALGIVYNYASAYDQKKIYFTCPSFDSYEGASCVGKHILDPWKDEYYELERMRLVYIEKLYAYITKEGYKALKAAKKRRK